MTRRRFAGITALLFAGGAAIRIHNAFSFPLLASYDGFAHFTYVWYLAVTRHVPMPTAGWEFFQPPLYYASMATVWTMLASIDPMLRLHVATAIVAGASLVHAAVVWDLARRWAPTKPRLALLGAAFMLFLPVQLYSAGFFGNEGLTAVLCSVAFWLLLAYLRRPNAIRSASTGIVLGLALLTKVTALAVVVGALATVALKSVVGGRLRATAPHLGIMLAAVLAISGWYYLRNVEHYGTPFVMSRRELMLRMVEDALPQARRSAAEYLLFDPVIFRRPMWPRGASDGDGAWSRSLRDAVWTGLYANTWFDGFGGWAVPRVTESEPARRAGQALMILGLVPTALVLLGIGSAVVRLGRRWDDLHAATLLTLVPMLAIFVIGTRTVPIAAAVKATYLLPVTVAFGVSFVLGVERLEVWWPRSWRVVAAALALIAAVALPVFWHGLVFSDRQIRGSFPLIEASMANQDGVVSYAGGDRRAARARFERAAAEGLYLGYENLALLAFDDGHPDDALHLLKRAMRRQPTQSSGRSDDRALYDRLTRAEHLNLVAVFADAAGRPDRARRAAATAVRLDPTLPEAHYDLAVAVLADPPLRGHEASRAAARDRAHGHLYRALALDPAFVEAQVLRSFASTLDGCAASALPAWRRSAPGTRAYPVETGTGAPHAASIGRRRHVDDPMARLWRAWCG